MESKFKKYILGLDNSCFVVAQTKKEAIAKFKNQGFTNSILKHFGVQVFY
jgi:hypothetical protein